MTLDISPTFTWNETVWNPSMLGPALWLDAADASTITLNGSTVSQWSDKSGNGFHVTQATASLQPTYQATGFNSQPTVYFDNSGDEMGCDQTSVSSRGDLFYAAVFQMLSDTQNWSMIVGTNTSSASDNDGTLLMQRMSTRSEIGIHNSGVADTRSTYAVQVTNLFVPRIATAGRSGGVNGDGGTITVTATAGLPFHAKKLNLKSGLPFHVKKLNFGPGLPFPAKKLKLGSVLPFHA